MMLGRDLAMYDELKNKSELRKSITHITLSITVLTTIAVIIRFFTKNPPESWVSALNNAGTISIVYYMGVFNSKFTYLRWLAISKKFSYKMFLVFIAIIFLFSLLCYCLCTIYLSIYFTLKMF